MPCKGGKVQLAGGGAPPFLRSAHLECPSSVILVTAPALTGAGAIAADRQSAARSVIGQPNATSSLYGVAATFRAGRQRGPLSSNSCTGSNHTQTLITFAYHWVRRILMRLRSSEQIARYDALCGYADSAVPSLTIITGTTADRSALAIKPVSSPRGMQRRPRRPRNLYRLQRVR
jgi:hypothetical protein